MRREPWCNCAAECELQRSLETSQGKRGQSATRSKKRSLCWAGTVRPVRWMFFSCRGGGRGRRISFPSPPGAIAAHEGAHRVEKRAARRPQHPPCFLTPIAGRHSGGLQGDWDKVGSTASADSGAEGGAERQHLLGVVHGGRLGSGGVGLVLGQVCMHGAPASRCDCRIQGRHLDATTHHWALGPVVWASRSRGGSWRPPGGTRRATPGTPTSSGPRPPPGTEARPVSSRRMRGRRPAGGAAGFRAKGRRHDVA